MPKKTVFEKAMDRDVDSKSGSLEVMEAPRNMTFSVEIEFDKELESEFGRDSILLEEMNEEGQKVYKELIDDIGTALKQTDKTGIRLRDANLADDLKELVTAMNKEIQRAKQVTEQEAAKKMTGVWTNYQKKKKEYQKYRIKIGVDIGMAAASLAFNISMMATSGFTGGASAAFAVIGMYKSASTIANAVKNSMKDVETAAADLEKQIGFIKNALITSKKDQVALNAAGTANEYAMAVTTQFLGLAGPNIKSCEKDLARVEQKLNGITLACHELSKELNKVLDKQEELVKDFRTEAAKKLSKHPSPKKAEQLKEIDKALQEYLKPEREKVDGFLEEIKKQYVRVKKAEERTEELTKEVAILSDCRGKGVKILENLLLLTDLATAPLDGNKLAEDAGELAKGFTAAGIPFVYERLSSKVCEGTWLA